MGRFYWDDRAARVVERHSGALVDLTARGAVAFVPGMGERDWNRLIYQLKNGDCTPFLGAGACAGTLPTGGELSRTLAEEYCYPFDDKHELPRVSQFVATTEGDAVHLKNLICEKLRGIGPPDFTNRLEPHGLLAEFPLPVYLTTNYDDFIQRSLQAAGKKPNVAICPWNGNVAPSNDLFSSESGWDPKPETPLVYHLHGNLTDPSSLVLTEDDYVEFLSNLALNAAGQGRMLPPSILAALTRRPILFIGYSLQDWTFRVLFHALMKAVPAINLRRHVSVQLKPTIGDSRADVDDVMRQLGRYYEDRRISIFWGTAEEFCRELRQRMGSSS